MKLTKATRSAKPKMVRLTGVLAALMLTASPLALHAEVSNDELAKEIAELKAQIRSLKGGVAEAKKEARHSRRTTVVAAPAYVPPPAFASLPPGATPVYATADKKMIFGALTITPGGFVAAEDVFRSRAQNRELDSTANSIPFGPQAGISENRLSARGTRAALLIEAPISRSFLVSGYGEIDFQGTGTGSNYNQSSSYVPRIRHLYAGLDNSDYGMHVLAGQTFSLATINSKGITPRNEALTPTIDYNYVTGFVYKRQAQIRLTKDFDKKLWLSLSVENPGDTFQGCTGTGVNDTTINGHPLTCNLVGAGSALAGIGPTTGTGTTTSGSAGNAVLSLNHIPDVIGKAAYEARFADRDIHVEGFGIYRQIDDRVAFAAAGGNPALASNSTTNGWGVGYGVIVPVIPKRLDFQSNGLIGRGVGSYGVSQIADAAFKPNGQPLAVRSEAFNGGLILHATQSIDIYGFGGIETAHQSTFGAGAIGYGAPTATNSGCFNFVNGTAATCAANTKRVYEVTGGFWDKLYKGQFGEVRVGAQYAFQQRELFQGSGGGAARLRFAPTENDHIVYTSLRYYPFQ